MTCWTPRRWLFPGLAAAPNSAALTNMLDATLLTHGPAACLGLCSVRILEMFALSVNMTQLQHSLTLLSQQEAVICIGSAA